MPLPTFGFWRRKQAVVLDYKHRPVDGMEGATEEFYRTIEEELKQRQVPGLEISREEFAEGGLLSVKRVYLRMRRERLVFDICSAPFGKTWFYSYRFSEIPVTLMLWELLLVLFILANIIAGYMQLFGALGGSIIIGTTILGLGALLRHSLSLGFYGLDDFLLRVPVFGIVYEALLRKNTYYREDSREMFRYLVGGIIEACAAKEMADKGFEQQPFIDATPDIHRRLAELLKLPTP